MVLLIKMGVGEAYMLKIAIVDDEYDQIQEINQVVSGFFTEKKITISIDLFTNGEDLLNATAMYDIIFLDIQMGGIDGIETAQKLRINNKRTALFYVTSYSDYVLKSMSLHPFAFIVKPYSKDEIYKNLEDYIEFTNNMSTESIIEYFKFQYEKQLIKINIDEICYFHYIGNRIIEIVTKTRKYQISDSISKLFETLNHKIFLMPEQSFIVNIEHISRIDGKDKTLVMKNGCIIPIARRKYTEFFNLLNEYLSN